MTPKPVDLPPPKAMLKPNTKMVCGSDTLYIFASLSFSSALGTDPRPGCSTSMIYAGETRLGERINRMKMAADVGAQSGVTWKGCPQCTRHQ